MRILALLALFLCFSPVNSANSSETENWCGTYFEEDGRGYIRLARADFGTGSTNCNINEYTDRVAESGTANIALEFTHNKSTVNKWRKFNNHVIEVRGKFRNGSISNTRFIRDMGV